MKIGTRSLLFGAHNIILHPLLVFVAWCRLYGFPYDPRLWISFIVHDWGYWGKPNMDGAEGETHVELGATLMGIFGAEWVAFTRHHSRYYSRRDDPAREDAHPVGGGLLLLVESDSYNPIFTLPCLRSFLVKARYAARALR